MINKQAAAVPAPGERPPTRDRLLRAAIALIAEVGADNLRTRAVAERAGVNQALVHYHFGSMAGLVRAAVDTVAAADAAPYLDALHGAASATEAVAGLFEVLQGVGEVTAEQLVMFDLLARATRGQPTRGRVQRLLADGRRQVTERLAEAQRRGEIDPGVDVGALATMLLALLDGLGIHRLIDPETDVAAVGDLVLTTLVSPAGSAHELPTSGGTGE